MKKDALVFYILGVLILSLGGFCLFSKGACNDFLNIIAGAENIYHSELPGVKRKEVSFNESFIKDERFLSLRQDWLAPATFSELTASSSEIKKNIDFKIGNQQLFKVDETEKK